MIAYLKTFEQLKNEGWVEELSGLAYGGCYINKYMLLLLGTKVVRDPTNSNRIHEDGGRHIWYSNLFKKRSRLPDYL